MTTLEEIANILNGTLQEDTQYRGRYVLSENLATFDLTGLSLTDYATELVEGLNGSEDGGMFTFTHTTNTEGGEFISVTKK